MTVNKAGWLDSKPHYCFSPADAATIS